MAKIFNEVQPPKLKRSKFDLSHDFKFDCDMGQLIPVCAVETVPGDYFKINEECVIRTVPMSAPVLQEINAYVHYFFVPYRILCDSDDDWTVFLTGGKDGKEVAPPLPRWNPTSDDSFGSNGLPSGSSKYSLWDYFGFPVGLTNFTSNGSPVAFPKRAYNLIWNDFYRDENQQEEIDLDTDTIQFRNVQKDYFTSALPWIVRGAMPTIPITGTIPLSVIDSSKAEPYTELYDAGVSISGSTVDIPSGFVYGAFGGADPLHPSETFVRWEDGTVVPTAYGPIGRVRNILSGSSGFGVSNLNTGRYGVNLTGAGNISVEDLRQMFAQERWLRRNALTGVRYDEFLVSHFAVAPRSEVLDEPEYIGGVKMPMMVSEVAQTSATQQDSSGQITGSPQGNLTGNGLTANGQFVGTYRAKEFGVIIGILSVLPVQAYCDGIERAWLKESKFDFYFPEFAELDAQPIWKEEIFAKSDSSFNSADIFGYQGRYDELRHIPSRIAGGFRDTYDEWHLARRFSEQPELNDKFLSAEYYSTSDGKRIFTVQDNDLNNPDAERTLLINYRNVISAVRPLPYMPN